MRRSHHRVILLLTAVAALLSAPSQCRAQGYTITTVAGGGNPVYPNIGDGGLATKATLNNPVGVAVDAVGNIYIADQDYSIIRRVGTNGIITTVAGVLGSHNFAGDGGLATSASLDNPSGVAIDSAGNLYIADDGSVRVRKVSPAGIITTFAGGGVNGPGDGGLATSAQLGDPVSVCLDSAGNLYITDAADSKIRKVTPQGIISTVAGNGTSGFSGDGGLAINAELFEPRGVAVDTAGNVYIADSVNTRVRKVSPTGIITTVAGGGHNAGNDRYGDGGPALSAYVLPTSVTVDAAGNIYLTDASYRIRKITPDGMINAIAGTGTPGFLGDGGAALNAELTYTNGIALGTGGTIYFSDAGDLSGDRVRLLTPAGGTAPAGPPFGSFDTPANNSTNVEGAIAVTGWALSYVGVASLGIYRDPLPGEPAQANRLVFLGDADFITGARPDVASAFPNYPQNNRGWGLQLLTNELPGTDGKPIGNGTYTLHAIATDTLGGTTDLGTKVITVDNASSNLPFGTIDTPTQGGLASGSAFVNFGWALTPQPNLIPIDGSTITVYVDNLPKGHPVYNNARTDIETLFPGYQNTGGAVGYFVLDTTKLTNGLHTIAWVVIDTAGHASGVGSRYFMVQN